MLVSFVACQSELMSADISGENSLSVLSIKNSLISLSQISVTSSAICYKSLPKSNH